MAQSPRILIAGAGIGGLCAALALLRRGFDVTVLEQAQSLGELGAGVQISSNGARALFSLGLEDKLKSYWSEPAGKEVRLWNSGQTWKLFDLGTVSRERYGAPYFMIHRFDLHRLLFDAVMSARSDAIRLGTLCTGFRQNAREVEVLSQSGAFTGDVLIGADGVHSQIRNALFGKLPAEFTGCLAWRGLVPAASLPPHLLRSVGTNWVGPGGHVVHYFVRRGELFNFVGILERGDWRVESWTERGATDECLNDFRGWHEDIHAIIRNIDRPYKWALLSREPLERWTIGRVTLLGDAAHPSLPMMAQGANMAIEDAVVLSRCFEAETDVETALARYEAARRERASRLVRAANDNTRRFHNPQLGSAEGARDFVETEWQEDKIKQRYDWIFEYDATRVAV